MLVNFYTPELKGDVKIIRERFEDLGGVLGMVALEKYRDRNEVLSQSKEFSEQITAQANIAKNKLTDLVNSCIDFFG